MSKRRDVWIGWIVGVGVASAARAASIRIHLPPGTGVTAAVARVAKDATLDRNATVTGDTVTVADAKLGMAYDVQVTLADGTVLQGVDLGWYSRVPDRGGAGPLTDADRQAMADVLARVLSFFNRNDLLLLRGTHNRAVMLVDLRRDAAFHSDQGQEVIWRPELWYFENHHGGWEKVQQTDRNLRRERFPTPAAYHAVVDKLRWVPELGGLKVRPGGPDVSVTLPARAGVPATRPAAPTSPGDAAAGGR